MSLEKIISYFKVAPIPNFSSTAFLILRLIAGAAFVLHGWGKIQNPFGWMPATASVPPFLQFLAAVSEFGGGIAWMLGLLTPLASFGLICTMAVASSMHAFVMKDPFVNQTGGTSYELALVYLGVSILLLAAGPGKFSLDAKIFGIKNTGPML